MLDNNSGDFTSRTVDSGEVLIDGNDFLKNYPQNQIPEKNPQNIKFLTEWFGTDSFRNSLKQPESYRMRCYNYWCAVKWGIPIPRELLEYLQDQKIRDVYGLTLVRVHPVDPLVKQETIKEGRMLGVSEHVMRLLEGIRVAYLPR